MRPRQKPLSPRHAKTPKHVKGKPESMAAAKAADTRRQQNPPQCYKCGKQPADGWSAFCKDCG